MASPPVNLLNALFLLLLLFTSPASAGKCNKDDKKVLLAIKKALGNPYILIAWTSQFPCCEWYGVGCDESTSRVTDLDIDGADDTTFSLPPSLADLPFLSSLTFRKNPGLVGPIPPFIGTMRGLTFLRLDWNALSGPVPDFLGNLLRLDYLNLAFNRLSGSIPPSLGRLIILTFLDISRNQLTGPIPDTLGISNLAYIYLSHNNLTGSVPQSFAQNTLAEDVDLSWNQLSGDALALFGRKKPLQRLDLSRNHEIEFDMGKAEIPEKMVALDLNHNKVFGSLPPVMGEVPWQLLNVSYNRLCGPIPAGSGIERWDEYSFLHNKCLCGPPLPPCK